MFEKVGFLNKNKINLLYFLVPKKDIYNNADESYFTKISNYEKICTPSSEHGLNTSNVQKIIHSQDLQFDLVINEEMFHESWLMFGYKFNAPVVTICMFFDILHYY